MDKVDWYRFHFEQMAGGLEGMRGSRDLSVSKGFLQIFLLVTVIWMQVPRTVYGQQPEGFLSINCGAVGFTDTETGLEWVTDINSEYIMTGNSSMELNSSSTFRYFPENRDKYCYELPTTPNTTYLVRAGFAPDRILRSPIQFSVSIDATAVFTVKYDSSTELDGQTKSQEVIFYSSDNFTNVCLRPDKGWPFITSLELRRLDSAMYAYSGSQRQYLTSLARWNASPNSTGVVRYPADSYDRIWKNSGDLGLATRNGSTALDQEIRANINSVPPVVMQDAWGGYSFTVTFLNLFSSGPLSVDPGQYVVYVALYAEDLDATSAGGNMTVSLDGDSAQELNVSAEASMLVNTNFLLSSNALTVDLGAPEGQSSSIVTMNAMEIYGQYNFNFSRTASQDDAAITAVKESFDLVDWQGDPCTPVPHDWLSCHTRSTGYASTEQEACTNKTGECIGKKGDFLRAEFGVTSLKLSNIPNSGFSILQNTPTVTLSSLTEMSITRSGVDLSTFQFLTGGFSGGELNILDFADNSIESFPSDWTGLGNLASLNLCRNNLSGEMYSFAGVPFVSSLQTLNLSHNSLIFLPTMWGNTLKNLTVLDLSYNKFLSNVSSLDGLVEINSKSLQELYISNNSFSGTISPLYFSPTVRIANFDGNNIQGTLDLSTWFAGLQQQMSENSTARVTRNLYSFLDNNILHVVPDVKDMESTINSLRGSDPDFRNNGILLGGNPYCKGARSEAQQYLCRFKVRDPITKPNNDSQTILIIGLSSGVVAAILSSITLVTVWRLLKQVKALRDIQKALSNQKVQPPFFQYSDLKLATKDFHKDNKLGHGGFGEVYKGVLPDKTDLAVKKLFNSQKLQVLNEFLNEVVLITGIKHRNLVQLKGCCIKDKQRMLVYEYVENGNLAQALWGSKAYGALDWNQRLNICMGVARGLSYLHEELQPSIIHRDIKPENILLGKNFQPKIADFGLARHFSDDSSKALYTQIAGTLGYFAPEYATQGQLSDKADVYSYGIVVLEVISGRKCIDYSQPQEAIFLKDWVLRMQKKRMLLDTLQPELRDNCVASEVIRALNIGLLCTQNDPEKRPSMSQVVNMLLGSREVEVPLEESKDMLFDVNSLLAVDHQVDYYPTLPPVVEDESNSAPLIQLDVESSSSTSSNRPSGTSIIQMNDLVGR